MDVQKEAVDLLNSLVGRTILAVDINEEEKGVLLGLDDGRDVVICNDEEEDGGLLLMVVDRDVRPTQ